MDMYVIESERSLMVSAVKRFNETKTEAKVRRVLELHKKWSKVHYAHTCLMNEFIDLFGRKYLDLGCQSMGKVVAVAATLARRDALMNIASRVAA